MKLITCQPVTPVRTFKTSIHHRLVIGVTLLAGIFQATATVQAQPDRRQMFENLLQSLIETQLERHLTPRAEPPRSNPPTVSPKVLQARESLNAFAEESGHVLETMQADAARAPGVRPLLGEMLRLRADATVLARQSIAVTDLEPLTESVQQLDRRWRLVSHRLSQMDGLTQTCSRCVNELNQIDQDLCRLFQIQAQIDGRELLRLADSLTADVGNLVEDIEIEFGRTRDGQALLLEGRRVQQQARYFADSIGRNPAYDAIVAEFGKYHDAYSRLALRLWPLENRYLERSMRRIEETDRQVHMLLWLPQPLNRQQLNHLTTVLTQRVDDLFDKVTLQMLIASPAAANVLNTAGQFHGCCENFALTVESDGTADDLRAEFLYMQDAWPELAQCFRGIHDQDVDQLLKEIEQTYLSMRDALQIQTQFDRRAAIELAAELESQLEHLLADLRHELAHGARQPQSFQARALQACQALWQAAGKLHENLANNQDLESIQRSCIALQRDWSTFHDQYLDKLVDDPRSHIHETVEQVTPLIVQLRTMLPL